MKFMHRIGVFGRGINLRLIVECLKIDRLLHYSPWDRSIVKFNSSALVTRFNIISQKVHKCNIRTILPIKHLHYAIKC